MEFKVQVPLKAVANALVVAFDGASRYWIIDREVTPGKEPVPDAIRHLTETGLWKGYVAPFCGGSVALHVEDPDDCEKSKWYVLDQHALESGLHSFSRMSPNLCGLLLADRIDNDVADVFLQHCLFGKEVFA